MQPGSDERLAFLTWARRARLPLATGDPSQDDLAAIASMLKGARIVGLGEAVHGDAEVLRFRNRLFRHLVERHGFTAIALESGIVEGRLVHDYVGGRTSDLDAALSSGISWTFDGLAENRALIEWLRAHNARVDGRPVNFYGFDLAGSPGLGRARRGVQTALDEALAYLATVDPARAFHMRARLDALLPNLRFDLCRAPDDAGYDRLSAAERDLLTGAVADLIAMLERHEAQYIERSDAEHFAWGHRAALNARDVDVWLRQVPLGWQPARPPVRFPSDATSFLSAANDVRDRAQAENLQWILEREGSEGRVLVFAHRYHLSAAPMRASWADTREHRVMGTYLRARLGAQFATIGHLVGHGEAGSIDALAGDVGAESYVLDLRRAPLEVARWLQGNRVLGFGSSTPEDGVLEVSVGRAFDLVLHHARLMPT
jgi:erythromycin esterase